MNKINQCFQQKEKNILSVYFCAGYPTLNSTVEIIQTLEEKGVDMIEIGIPFSDPMADGKVIQEASAKALSNGMSLRLVLKQLINIRSSVKIPLIIMSYLNPIMQYGFEAFCKDCQTCGIDGVIIPDLPFQNYVEEYKSIAATYNLKIIMLITPETSEARIRKIDEHTEGFIYMVSSASTTGSKERFEENDLQYFESIQHMNLKNPCLIGFGISNASTYNNACEKAAGCIIGSKFVSLLAQNKPYQTSIEQLFVEIGKKK
jgi:tryptophan synthase alpha chain